MAENSQKASATPVELTFDAHRLARRVLLFCIAIEITFVILDYHVNYGEWTDIGAMRRMFNTAREDGLASWFAATQTLMAGLTLGLIYLSAKKRIGHCIPVRREAGAEFTRMG